MSQKQEVVACLVWFEPDGFLFNMYMSLPAIFFERGGSRAAQDCRDRRS